jgi:hypothetical protein
MNRLYDQLIHSLNSWHASTDVSPEHLFLPVPEFRYCNSATTKKHNYIIKNATGTYYTNYGGVQNNSLYSINSRSTVKKILMNLKNIFKNTRYEVTTFMLIPQ